MRRDIFYSMTRLDRYSTALGKGWIFLGLTSGCLLSIAGLGFENFPLIENRLSNINDEVKTLLFSSLLVFGFSFERAINPIQRRALFIFGLGLLCWMLTFDLHSAWDHVFLQPDSRSYIRGDNYRTPLYPLFIDLLTWGENLRAADSYYHGPIGKLITDGSDSPLVWPIRMQKVILVIAFIAFMVEAGRSGRSFVFLSFGFVVVSGHFLSEEQDQLLAESLTQAFTLFCMMGFLGFLRTGRGRWLLLLSLCFILAVWTRPSSIFLFVVPVIASLCCLLSRGQSLRQAVATVAMFSVAPVFLGTVGFLAQQYQVNDMWPPVPTYAEKRIGLALQIAGKDDVEKMVNPLASEFLARALERKWKQDWDERRYLRNAFPGRNFSLHPERGHEFLVRNANLVAAPVSREMEAERGLRAHAEGRTDQLESVNLSDARQRSEPFRNQLYMDVADGILGQSEHMQSRILLFYDAVRDAIHWQHRVRLDLSNRWIGFGGILCVFLLGLVVARNRYAMLGVLFVVVHLAAITVFCLSNIATERFTHATEILFVFGCACLIYGLLERLASGELLTTNQRMFGGQGKQELPKVRGTLYLSLLLVVSLGFVIFLPGDGAINQHRINKLASDMPLLDDIRPRRVNMHSLSIPMELAARQLGSERAQALSTILKTDQRAGFQLVLESGLFNNEEECVLLTSSKRVCGRIFHPTTISE